MEVLKTLIAHAQTGDLSGFSEIVRRFQSMAVGYAYSILGDFHLAEDVAQEAFIEAYQCLPNLRDPDAFPGWFRKIVFKQCDRMLRGKSAEIVPLESAAGLHSEAGDPLEFVEVQEMKDSVLTAIAALPVHERTVTTLFYIDGFSQNEIADFLEVPVTTVNSRLRYSRKRLKERLITMVQETMKEKRPSKDERFVNKVAVGLKDIIAGKTRISQIDPEKIELTYRGYNINDLAVHATFEEVAYLLLIGNLPTKARLDAFCKEIAANRALPDWVIATLRLHPKTAHPMDMLRSGISALGAGHPDANDNSHVANLRKAKALIGQIPTVIAASQRIQNGQTPIAPRADLGYAANLLYMLNGEEPATDAMKTLEISLILHAEHGYNASTFAGRVIASTQSDIYSGVCGAMGALKGRSHGGANEKVMQMLLEIDAVEKAEAYLDQKLKKGELIMGFGHRVYHDGDSRVPIMSGFAKTLGERLGITKWSEMAAVITSAMRHEKGLHPNIDFPSAYTYYLLGIPIELYTSLFVAARIAGWTAHLIEQHDDNRLIRPISVYEGATEAQWVPIDNRC